MKKNTLLVLCAMLVALSSAFAADVTVQDAQAVAVNFFKLKLGNSAPRNVTATLQYTRSEADNTVDFYAFNMAPAKGFVIVSATDNDQPVIGYSTESLFPADFSRIGMANMLNRWSQELHYVKLNNIVATTKAAPLWAAYRQGAAPASEKATTVGPLCQTTWDQNTEYSTGPNLYNNYCPGGTGTNQAVTGCVATAMAQIMRYWKYPTKGLSSSSYSDEKNAGYSENYGTLTCNYADSTFLWANMPLTLTNTSTTAQIDAIGTLMKCAGVSVDMDYSPTGSGALVLTAEATAEGVTASAQQSYVKYFGYQNVIEGIGLSGTHTSASINVSTTAFEDSIEAELNAGRLVQMEGDDQQQGGHTWVLDGYETSPSVMFHMNWGWSGYSDGFFAVTNLDPSDGGTTNLDFSEDIAVLTHILPPVQPGTTTITELASVTTNAVCAGVATQLSATTHTGATYSWSPATGLSSATVANPVATPLTTTTYTVTADSAGVTATSSVTITVHPVPAATATATNPACFGYSNGSVTASVSGGTAGYTYLWSNGQTLATASNLPSGTYSVTITDAKSCTASATETITQPGAINVSSNPVNATCGQANGSIAINTSGGTSGYTYHWSNNETTATATNLSAGTYDVTVTDAHSCSVTTSASITGSGTLNLVTNAVNVSCYGTSTGSATATVTGNTGSVSYHWSNGANTVSIQNVAAATYTVTITDGSGCSATLAQTISQPTAISPSVTVVNAGCGTSTGSAAANVTGGTGTYTYLWSTGATSASITNIPSGNYSLSVTDANQCSASAAAFVPAASPLTASVVSSNVTCFNANDGTGQITMNTGTAPYDYSWSNGATAALLTNLPVGSYSVTVTDANHCTTSGSISVTQPAQIQFATNSTSATENQDNGSASITSVTGGTAPYEYSWSNGNTTQAITNLAGGTYTITVTDAKGCSQTATDVVNVKASTGVNTVGNQVPFSIYPNPARNQVLVQLEQFNNATTLNLTNILGQTLISQEISSAETQLDLSSLAGGVYLIQLKQDGKMSVKQLVITR